MREQQFELESIKMQFKLFINISLRIYLFYFICSSLKSTRICGWINISEQFSLFQIFFRLFIAQRKITKGHFEIQDKKKLHQEFQRAHFKVIFLRGNAIAKFHLKKVPFNLISTTLVFILLAKGRSQVLNIKKEQFSTQRFAFTCVLSISFFFLFLFLHSSFFAALPFCV